MPPDPHVPPSPAEPPPVEAQRDEVDKPLPSPYEDPDGRTARRASDLKVPLVDEAPGGRVYDPSILRWALVGAVIGGLLFGGLAASFAYGSLPVVGLGPFSASGEGVAVSTGGGLGLALGGLAGALLALFHLPKRMHSDRPH